jgi:hypothetical protein
MRAFLVSAMFVAVVGSTGLSWAEQPDPGDMGVFFTPTPVSGAQAVLNGVQPFEFFDVYVVSFDVPSGMDAYEFSVNLSAFLVVTGGRNLPASAEDSGAGNDNWIVGTGGICRGQVGPFVLVTYSGVGFVSSPAPEENFICLSGATPSSFADGLPGYLTCNSPGELHEFGRAYLGCAVVNGVCCPIATAKSSFGSLKRSYGSAVLQ